MFENENCNLCFRNILIFLFFYSTICDNQNGDDGKNHFVFSGKCANRASNFCNDQVENSICNTVKDECFCRNGFVAIREGLKISCKTLLTDIICRIDKDCIHVSGSMCHPGAGQCVCPAQHIYVEVMHSCRRKFDDLNNPICQICRQSGGQCFKYITQDRKNNQIKSKNSVGCSCNNHRATSDSTENICDVHLVDIGGYCNDRDLKCRSKKAICSRIQNNDSIFSCNCITGYVPVYQKTLLYHECFPVVSESTSLRCARCFQSEGYCYDINNDHEGDGCLCQNKFSNENDGPNSLTKPCTINHVTVHCNTDHMTVCYVPHNLPPYRSLAAQLKNGRSLAVVKSPQTTNKIIPIQRRLKMPTGSYSQQFINNRLKVSTSNSGELMNKFCANIDLTDERIVQADKLKNGNVRFSASLHVIVDAIKSNPGKDFTFPLTCITKNSRTKIVQKNYSSESVHEHYLSLDLRILNPDTNTETNSVTYNDQIKLDVSLVDSQGTYFELEILKCFVSDNRIYDEKLLSNGTGNLLYTKCESYTNFYLRQRIAWLRASHGIHYQSLEFRPQPINNSSTLYFHCQILLCRHQILCVKHPFCGQESDNQIKEDQFRILTRSAQLNFHRIELVDLSSNIQDAGIKECRYSLCLTQLQAIMTTLLMLFLLFLVIILVIILHRRQRAIQKIAIKKKKILVNSSGFHQVNTLCSQPYGQKLYLLSDNGSLTTSIDKSESDPYFIQNQRFLQNDSFRMPLSNFQDNFPNSYCQQLQMYDTYPNNSSTIRKSVHISTQVNNLMKDNDRVNGSETNPTMHDVHFNVSDSFSANNQKIPVKDKLSKTDNQMDNGFMCDEFEIFKDTVSLRSVQSSNKDNYYV